MLTLDFTPASITVRTIVGASLAFSVTTKKADGSLFPLDGYTITAPFLPRDGAVPPVDAFTVELTDVATITLSLTSEQTAQLAANYVQSPIVWNWATWLESAAGRIAMLRGGLMLSAP
jgi:hypothetical protein